jgi:hypothetical protein
MRVDVVEVTLLGMDCYKSSDAYFDICVRISRTTVTKCVCVFG